MNPMHQTYRRPRHKPTLLALAFVLAQIGCGGERVVERPSSDDGVAVSEVSAESCVFACSTAAASILVHAGVGFLLEDAQVAGCLAAVVNSMISSPVDVLSGPESLARSFYDAVVTCLTGIEVPIFGGSDPSVVQCAFCILQVSCLPTRCESACTSRYGAYARGSCGPDGISGACVCQNLCTNNCNGDCQSQHGYATWSGTCGGDGGYQCTCQNNCEALCDPFCTNGFNGHYGSSYRGTCDSGGACSCTCDSQRCDSNCRNDEHLPGGYCDSGGCHCNAACTDTCTEATCGMTVCGQQCPACCTMDECGVCNGPGKVCGQCGYTGPTGGCDGCGNSWEDICGEPCGDGSSCGCNGSVNACGECNGPTGGCDGCGNIWYDACGQPCGDGSECSGGGGDGFCPDYGAGLCYDPNPQDTLSAGRSAATSSGHHRSPEERAARAADGVRLLQAWRLEATHKLKMAPVERVQLGKLLENQITALRQPGVRADGARRQAQRQANAAIAKLLGAQRFARYEAARREWMTKNQASRRSAH